MKVAIVSCDKWLEKLEEDNNLKQALRNIGIATDIISWQQSLQEKYDLLILKSVWGYQNFYSDFKRFLLNIKSSNIPFVNDVDMVLDNIQKDVQFSILRKNNIDVIDTVFLPHSLFVPENLFSILEGKNCVIKPSISGSGENTYLVGDSIDIPPRKVLRKEDIVRTFEPLLASNSDCKIMVQPFIKEINDGEYSCIFIDGELTHTMLRFPNIFHEKKKPYLITNVPDGVINLAKKVEQIEEFKNYMYMRVDMVLVEDKAKIMEVELADPDLLTKYIEDPTVKENVIKTFAKRIERRTR